MGSETTCNVRVPRPAWLSIATISGATAMIALDVTIVTVALADIGRSLHAGSGIEWIVTVYLLGAAAGQPATGWLSGHFGKRPVFRAAIALFTLASLGCALAPNLGVLIAMRAVQGLGGAPIFPVGMAMVFEIYPRERHGRAIATWATALMVSPALGPTIGGWLVTELSWHWLFVINLPVGVAAFVVSKWALPDTGRTQGHRLDVTALAIGTAGLALVVLGLSEGNAWGWGSPRIVAVLCAGLALTALFVRRSHRSPQPVLELSLLREPAVYRMVVMLFVLGGANYARLVFVPLELATVRGYRPLAIGLLLLPGAIVTAITMKLGGRDVDRVGLRRPALVGVVMMAVGTAVLASLRTTSPTWLLMLGLCLHGGFGYAYTANAVGGMSDLGSTRLAQAVALRNVAIQVAGAVSVGVFSAIPRIVSGPATDPHSLQRGYNVIFAVSAVTLVASMLTVRNFPGRLRRARLTPVEAEIVGESLS